MVVAPSLTVKGLDVEFVPTGRPGEDAVGAELAADVLDHGVNLHMAKAIALQPSRVSQYGPRSEGIREDKHLLDDEGLSLC